MRGVLLAEGRLKGGGARMSGGVRCLPRGGCGGGGGGGGGGGALANSRSTGAGA